MGKSCAFLGNDYKWSRSDIIEKIKKQALRLIDEEGVDTFLVGVKGAYERDAYNAVLDIREEKQNIRIVLVVSSMREANEGTRLCNDVVLPDRAAIGYKRWCIVHRNNWIIENTDFIIAYISKELFDKCTEVRTGKFKRTSKHTKEPYIFRGLVRCKHCGCLLSPYTKKDKYVYLRHTDLKNCEHCNNVSEKVLLKDVEKHLSSIHFDDDLKSALAIRLKKQYEATHGNTYYQLEKNRNELADVEENQKKLLDLLIAGTVPAEVYRSKNAEYETAKIELQAKIEKLQTPDTSVERAIDKVLNFSQNSFAIFKSSQIEEKRRILNIVFANFLMDGKNPEISMRKNFKLLSKIGACKDWCPGEDSNFHCLRQHAPEACASTNFATRASITDILLSHFKINCKHLFQKIIKISIRI